MEDDGVSKSYLHTLTPPATFPTGNWTYSTTNFSPAVPPRNRDGNSSYTSGAHHVNSLFYVPSIQRLAWVCGPQGSGTPSVYLINPT